MSRSYHKYPRVKNNQKLMKKIANRQVCSLINSGKFDEIGLSAGNYRKLTDSYEITEGALYSPLNENLQPLKKIEVMAPVYILDTDSPEEVLFYLSHMELVRRRLFLSTKNFNKSSQAVRKNPYPKNTEEHERFIEWAKDYRYK